MNLKVERPRYVIFKIHHSSLTSLEPERDGNSSSPPLLESAVLRTIRTRIQTLYGIIGLSDVHPRLIRLYSEKMYIVVKTNHTSVSKLKFALNSLSPLQTLLNQQPISFYPVLTTGSLSKAEKHIDELS